MPPEQNPQGRRPHHYRGGRRGPDRRGPDRRTGTPPQQQQEQGGGRDHVDVEQIMREIRSRISQRHGIDLSTQQIQELAARRLEAILDPRTMKPSLLEQLRRSAATPVDAAAAETTPPYEFEDRTIYESHNALLRFIRRLLNPILKLFFNPNPIAHALNTQAKLNAEASRREAERDRRQAEWNALHFDILQRLVTETARVSIEMQSLSARVEALGARVDFNDRRVRVLEAAAPVRSGGRPADAVRQAPIAPAAGTGEVAVPATAPAERRAPEPGGPEGSRRRRRRRRGRRGGGAPGDLAPGVDAAVAAAEPDLVEDDGDEGDDLDADASEEQATPPSEEPPTAAAARSEEPAPTAAAAPPPFPVDQPGAPTVPTPPPDEPEAAPSPVDREPEER